MAIRDGFMANHYSKQQGVRKNDDNLEVIFFDTNLYDIKTLYQEEKNDSLIIGPLDKNTLSKILEMDLVSTRTLALNYLPDTQAIPKNLYQFGLAPETETSQLAMHMLEKNLNKVGVIAPETEWGFRIHDSFNESLHKLGGITIENAFYQDQSSLSESVARLLDTHESKSRKQKIQRIIGDRLEFLPRRRKDIDAIFMISTPNVAKQLKPLFSYHYASNLPVFATSKIHTDNYDKSNNDLENIQFMEMPWMLSQTVDIKNQIGSSIPESKHENSRFYALGVDSYDLAPRIQLLQSVRESKIQGQTGTLSIDKSGIVSRNLEQAKFVRGRATTLQD